jgi:hypothetical protein
MKIYLLLNICFLQHSYKHSIGNTQGFYKRMSECRYVKFKTSIECDNIDHIYIYIYIEVYYFGMGSICSTICMQPVIQNKFNERNYYQTLRTGESGIRVTEGAENFSLCHHIQTGSEAHPAYLMGTGRSFPGIKRPGHVARHPLPPSVEIKNEWSYKFTPPCVFII